MTTGSIDHWTSRTNESRFVTMVNKSTKRIRWINHTCAAWCIVALNMNHMRVLFLQTVSKSNKWVGFTNILMWIFYRKKWIFIDQTVKLTEKKWKKKCVVFKEIAHKMRFIVNNCGMRISLLALYYIISIFSFIIQSGTYIIHTSKLRIQCFLISQWNRIYRSTDFINFN